MEVLRFGNRVAILWDVTKGRRKTSVWWSAAIISISSRAARSRSAAMQYEAHHGYKTTVSRVCFRTGGSSLVSSLELKGCGTFGAV
jgi:hypothetical protein